MRTIDVSALIDGARFNAFHARVLFWCALIIIFDGYDLVIYGVVRSTRTGRGRRYSGLSDSERFKPTGRFIQAICAAVTIAEKGELKEGLV
ncbi:hypothetical protein HK44_007150 [Pseudomonas fluorescens HK44]|uniref:Uncharacterized protein n=1 Tax=Pseudomonas fluorescens HK44 TaxID=1042209 RepID=A0A010RNN0_PSEFL|nr:hypothetical protein [Pseudomonas fluorescens]EXF94111.1 hypothetical protein HK44_007150 [Pseudomonas fluorescens HK44]